MRADGAAQRALDPLGNGGEVGLAVERRKNGAAHQSRAADAGQDRAGKPLHRDAAAIDDAAGAAVDRKRRLVAEIDGRIRSVPIGACAAWRDPIVDPLHCGRASGVTKYCGPHRSGPAKTESGGARCRAACAPVNDRAGGTARMADATLERAPLTVPIAAKNDRGMWLKCGAARRLCTAAESVKNGLNAAIASEFRGGEIRTVSSVDNDLVSAHITPVIRRAVRLRRDGAPLKLLTYRVGQNLREVVGGLELRRLSRLRPVGERKPQGFRAV